MHGLWAYVLLIWLTPIYIPNVPHNYAFNKYPIVEIFRTLLCCLSKLHKGELHNYVTLQRPPYNTLYL